MTGDDDRGAAAPGGDPVGQPPPWTLELLADLHGDVLDPATAARLRTEAATVPRARATLAALDATRADLAALPPVRMPDHIAARLDAAVRAEATRRTAAGSDGARPADPAGPGPGSGQLPGRGPGPAPPPPSWQAQPPTPTGGRPAPGGFPGQPEPPGPVPPVADLAARRRRTRLAFGGGAVLVAAAAALVIVLAPGLRGGGSTAGNAQPAPTTSPGESTGSAGSTEPLAVTSGNLGSALGEALNHTDYGPLRDAGGLDACLRANGVRAGADPLGVLPVRLDGSTPGVLIVLPTGQAARFRLLVVSPACGAGSPSTLADQTVGR
jgi:hypothetical protein